MHIALVLSHVLYATTDEVEGKDSMNKVCYTIILLNRFGDYWDGTVL